MKSNDLYRSKSNTSGIAKNNRSNLVLSTSFVSTRRFEDGLSSPISPLNNRQRSSTLNSLKHDFVNLQNELVKQKRLRQELELWKQSSIKSNEVYQGKYSTDHLTKHSIRLKASHHIREVDKTIRKLEDLLTQLKLKLDHTLKTNTELQPVTKSLSGDGNSFTPSNSVELNYTRTPEYEEQEDNSSVIFNPEFLDDSLSVPTPDKESATWLVSNYMQSLQEPITTKAFILEKANSLVELLKKNPYIKNELVLFSFSNTIQNLLLNNDTDVVSVGYRITRHLITDSHFIEHLFKSRIDAFLVMSLIKDNTYYREREQALKLIREFLVYNTGITIAITQAIINCVERPDDNLRTIAIETLLEISYINPSVVSQSNGFKVLELLLPDLKVNISQLVLSSLLDMLSKDHIRTFLLEKFSINGLLKVLSDSQEKSTLNIEKLQNSMILMANCFKNYNGLILLSQNDFQPLKHLITFLQYPLVCIYLMDLLFDVLRIEPLSYMKKRHSLKIRPSEFQFECSCVNQYIRLILKMISKTDFVPIMVSLITENNTSHISNSKIATNNLIIMRGRYLLSEYFTMSVQLCDLQLESLTGSIPLSPEKLAYEIYLNERMVIKLNRNRNTIGLNGIEKNINIIKYAKSARTNDLLQGIDEMGFKKMVYDSKVLQTKEYTLWDWNIIEALCKGPLMNSRRLEELTRNTKFIKRLLLFYRPLRFKFSTINRRHRMGNKYIQVGCQFFIMLTSTEEGIRNLLDDTKMIPQLATLIFNAMEQTNDSNQLFTEKGLLNTLSYAYFSILGTFTQSANGVKILEKWNIFTVIYKMFHHQGTMSYKFLLLILPELNLNYSPHCKIILGKALVDNIEEVRIKSTEILGKKLLDPEENNDLKDHLINLLVRQLYDLSQKVVAIADQILYEYFVNNDIQHNQTLQQCISKCIDQLVFIGSPILFELLGSSIGFKKLNDIEYISTQRLDWINSKNEEYVEKIEDFLMKEMKNSNRKPILKTLPIHFYESLSKTEEGISLIQVNGDIDMFAMVIRKFIEGGMPKSINEGKLKGCLWACGFIGSTTLGINLFEQYSIIKDMIEICYRCSDTNIKFTTFFVIGLISKTLEGCEILDELGWDCNITISNIPTGISIPNNIKSFLTYPEKYNQCRDDVEELITITDNMIYESPEISLDILMESQKLVNEGDLIGNEKIEEEIELNNTIREFKFGEITHLTKFNDDPISEKILLTVSKLGNNILSNSAIREIKELESKYESKFESPEIFQEVFELLETYRFKPPIRKFICELFINKKNLEHLVKRDRKRRK